MRSSQLSRGMHSKPPVFILIISILLTLGLVWSLAGCGKKTATPTATPTLPPPTPTPQPLPPALVETAPLPGSQIALKNPIKFYFNQPMDRPSVEGALSGEPVLSGSLTWQDDASLTFTPDAAFLPGTSLVINIAASAQSAKGMALLRPISLSYTTSSPLRLVQGLPPFNANHLSATSAVEAPLHHT